MSSYRWKTRSQRAFVAQFIRYVVSGHYFYVAVRVPAEKDVEETARKLTQLYDINRPQWKRQRRSLKRNAGIHLLGSGRLLVIMVTKGKHPDFYNDHGDQLRDIRRTAFHFGGYSIRFSYSDFHKRHKVNVRLDKETYRKVKTHLLTLGCRPEYENPSRLEAEIRNLPYEGYEQVVGQLFRITRSVNQARRRAGYPRINFRRIGKKVRVTKVFVDEPVRDAPLDVVSPPEDIELDPWAALLAGN